MLFIKILWPRYFAMKNTVVSIIIPTYNEGKTLRMAVARVQKAPSLGLKKQIIIVNDGSLDHTKRLLKTFTARNVHTFSHAKNQGKGAAVHTGLKHAVGSFVIIQDADLEYDPSDYPALLKPLIDGLADVVYGSRFIGNKPHRVLYFWHYVANRALTIFSNMFTNLNLSDMETGYKAFRAPTIKSIAPRLRSKGFGFEPEVTARLAKIPNIRIAEVGISYWGRTYIEGKKISWKDGVRAIGQIVYYHLIQ